MARIKFTEFLPTQTKNSIDKTKRLNEKHIRISESMLHSEAFKKLTLNAMRLYFEIELRFFRREARNEDFELSQTFATELLGFSQNSKNCGKRAIANLCHCGFIEPTYISKGGGKKQKVSNRFKFSENWKHIE